MKESTKKRVKEEKIKWKKVNLSKSQFETFGFDYLGFMQTADTEVLARVTKGEIDLNQLAKEVLARRGVDTEGKWIGFEKAELVYGIKISKGGN